MASCAHKKKEYIVVISEIKKMQNNCNLEVDPFYYKKHNFILIGNDRVFYFENKNFIEHPDADIKYDVSNPEFIRLMPSDLHEIEPDSLMPKLVLITKKKKDITISIASEKDTIRNKALSTFHDFFISMRRDSFYFGYNYRLMTEEESLVLNSKLHNIRYNPDSVHWKKKFGGTDISF